jgi:FkbM family methyltransferase
MNDTLRRRLWDAVRPLHAPLTRKLRRRLGRNFAEHPEMELPPPYETVQLDVERHLPKYLHVDSAAILRIVVVGAHEGDEILRMRAAYPKAQFLCFEPNPASCQRLVEKYRGLDFVDVRQLALADLPGKTWFYEMEMPGNGSLLEPDPVSWATINQSQQNAVSSFEVTLSTLDLEARGMPVDLLWMDVQGAEARVLAGAESTLVRTKAVFLEVALVQSPYKGAALFDEISASLRTHGFFCVALGVDGWNGTGNALFVREFDKLICRNG